MKPTLLFFALLLAVHQVSFGQAHTWAIGVTAGPSLVSMHGNPIIRDMHKPTVGYAGGISGQYHFSNQFSLVSQVAFERKGSVMKGIFTDSNGSWQESFTYYMHYDYLTLPLLARVTFGRHIRYFLNGGVYAGYLLRQHTALSPTRLSLEPASSLIRPWDAGLSTGFGMVVPVGQRRFASLEIRNNLGLVNISDVPVVNNGSIQTNSLNFLFGFSVTPGGK